MMLLTAGTSERVDRLVVIPDDRHVPMGVGELALPAPAAPGWCPGTVDEHVLKTVLLLSAWATGELAAADEGQG